MGNICSNSSNNENKDEVLDEELIKFRSKFNPNNEERFAWNEVTGNSTYWGDIIGHLKNGWGKLKIVDPNNPNVFKEYEGEFSNDLFHGFGKLTTNKYVYIGEFIDGKKSGIGRIDWLEDKTYYEGEWVENVRHGVGRECSEDSEHKFSYFGEYEFGNKGCNGCYITENEEQIYIGEFKNNQMEGIVKINILYLFI